MGSGYFRKCPKCGFEFQDQNGVGFLFPSVYKEMVQKAQNDELGKEIQTVKNMCNMLALGCGWTIFLCE